MLNICSSVQQTLRGEVARVEAELKEKKLECESWEESLKTGNERNTMIRQELKEAQATIAELRDDIKVRRASKMSRIHDSLERSQRDFEISNFFSQNKEDRLKVEFEGQLSSAEESQVAMKKELETLRKELAGSQDSLRRSEEELEALKQSPVQQENLQLRFAFHFTRFQFLSFGNQLKVLGKSPLCFNEWLGSHAVFSHLQSNTEAGRRRT